MSGTEPASPPEQPVGATELPILLPRLDTATGIEQHPAVPPALTSATEGEGRRDGKPTDPLAVATFVGLASVFLGGGYSLWRNRPGQFWPA